MAITIFTGELQPVEIGFKEFETGILVIGLKGNRTPPVMPVVFGCRTSARSHATVRIALDSVGAGRGRGRPGKGNVPDRVR